MKGRLKIIFVILGVALVSLANAQNNKPLTLNEAIDLSIKNSKQLKINRAKVEQASAAVKEAIQRRLPDASLSGSYIRLANPAVDLKTKSSNSGGSGGNGGGIPKVNQAAYGILSASLPIYAGGKISYGIESSKYLAHAEELDAENSKEEVIDNTIEAYVNLYKANAAVKLYEENLVQAQQRVKDFSNLEKNGLLARNDLLKVQLQASNVELSLLDARNNWELANVNMDLMLGLPENTTLAPDSTVIDQNFSVGTLDEYVQSALKNRKDMEAMGLRKQAADLGVKAIKADRYPAIALTGGYIAADIPKMLTITNAANIGVGISYNLGSLWKNKAKVEQAEAQSRQLEATQELMNNNIRLQVNRAYLNWLSSQKKLEVYTKAVEQADENYRIVKNKYNNGLATVTDLVEADVAQLQSHLNYSIAKADAVIVYNQLLEAAGTLSQPQTN
ncbi:MAG: TolC family protein [Flavisolibacter sp.]|nr:TolC family protein [Flavisolibacter sp.]